MKYPVFPITTAPLMTRPSFKKLVQGNASAREINLAIQATYADIERKLLINHLEIDPDFVEFQKLSKWIRFGLLYGGDPVQYLAEKLNG